MPRNTVYTGGQLAPSVRDVLPEDNALRVGKVLSVSGTTVTVDVAGGPPTVGVLGSYAPVVGDTVALFRAGATWLLMGRIGGGLSGVAPTGQSRIAFGQGILDATTLAPLVAAPLSAMSVSLTVPVDGCSWTAVGTFDLNKVGAVVATAIGQLRVDGVVQVPQALFQTPTLSRATVVQQWSGSGLNTGVHLFEGLGSATVAGTYNFDSPHCVLQVTVWR